MKKHLLAVFPLFVLTAACRTTQPAPDGWHDLPRARAPADAASRARSTADHGTAAVIAWIEGNDRAYARERLEAGLGADPDALELRLVRALLSIAELDDDDARDDLLHVVRTAPESAEAEAALVILMDRLRPARDRDALEPVVAKILEAGSAERVTIASAMLARLARASREPDAARSVLERGGFLRAWRAIGPLAPTDDRVFDAAGPYEASSDWSNPAEFRGAKPPVREAGEPERGRVAIDGRAGLYVLETFVELSKDSDGEPLLFEAHLSSTTRVLMDGTEVLAHGVARRQVAELVRVPLHAQAGWHRITVATIATRGTRPSFALLRQDGKNVIERTSRTLPEGARLSLYPPAVDDASTFSPRSARATALVDRWVTGGAWAWFGRKMASVVHLSGWYVDVDGAREHLFGVDEAAPSSAAMHMARARLYQWSNLPSAMVQSAVSEALASDAELPAALVSLGVAVRNDDPDRALELAERAAKAAPDSLRPDTLRLQIYRQRGWNAEAVQVLRSLVERDASQSLLREGAQFLRSLDRVDEAAKLEDLAVERSGVEAPKSSAKALLARADVEGAIAALKKDGGEDALAHAAALELARGHVDAAKASVVAALQADPEHAPSLEVRLRIAIVEDDLATIDATLAALQRRGNAGIQHEALRALVAKAPIAKPADGSWLAKTLDHDVWDEIRFVPGTTMPRGLDPADPRTRYQSVKLLDRVVDEIRPTGQALSWRHEVLRLQTKEATDRAGEFQVPGDALPLTLRTLKPDGSVVDVDRHAGKDDLSFSALAPGDAVELEWVDVTGAATPWGGYVRRFYFQGTTPTARADFVVIVPKGTKVWTHSYHGAPEPIVQSDGDRQIYVFTATDVPAFEPEPHAAPHEEYLPFVVVAVGVDHDLALATDTMGLEHMAQSSWDVEQTALFLTRSAKSPEERVETLFAWVAKEIGDGQARDPSTVIATRRGERAGVFTAMLRAVGVEADIVVAESGLDPKISPRYPATSRFDTLLVRIRTGNGPHQWAYLEGRQPWLGKLPPTLRNGAYVVASDPRRVHVFRDREVDHWVLRSNIELEVDEAGNAAGHVELTLPGTFGAQLREFLLGARKEAAERQLQGWLAALIPGARLVEFATINAESPLDPLGLRVRVAIDHFMVPDGRHLVNEQFFTEPLASRSIGLPSLASYLRTPQRETPMLLLEAEEEMTVSVRFPAGTTAPLETPKSFTQIVDFGQFTQAFEWDPKKHEARLVRLHRTPLMRLTPKAFVGFRESAQVILQSLRNRLIVPARRLETAARPAGDVRPHHD